MQICAILRFAYLCIALIIIAIEQLTPLFFLFLNEKSAPEFLNNFEILILP